MVKNSWANRPTMLCVSFLFPWKRVWEDVTLTPIRASEESLSRGDPRVRVMDLMGPFYPVIGWLYLAVPDCVPYRCCPPKSSQSTKGSCRLLSKFVNPTNRTVSTWLQDHRTNLGDDIFHPNREMWCSYIVFLMCNRFSLTIRLSTQCYTQAIIDEGFSAR
jgi:hypothetical protein